MRAPSGIRAFPGVWRRKPSTAARGFPARERSRTRVCAGSNAGSRQWATSWAGADGVAVTCLTHVHGTRPPASDSGRRRLWQRPSGHGNVKDTLVHLAIPIHPTLDMTCRRSRFAPSASRSACTISTGDLPAGARCQIPPHGHAVLVTVCRKVRTRHAGGVEIPARKHPHRNSSSRSWRRPPCGHHAVEQLASRVFSCAHTAASPEAPDSPRTEPRGYASALFGRRSVTSPARSAARLQDAAACRRSSPRAWWTGWRGCR